MTATLMNAPAITPCPAIKLIQELLRHDLRILAYDPLAIDDTKGVFGSAIEYVHSAESCLARVGLCVVALRARELAQAAEASAPAQSLTVPDCWRIIDPAHLDERINYVVVGRAA